MKQTLLFFILLSCSLVSRGQSTCAEAVSASSATNSLPATSDNYYWYRYTMPSEGKLQITSDVLSYIEVYRNTCANSSFEGYGYGNTTITTFNSGEEVFIRWNTSSGGDFDWNLSVSPLEAGDDCTLAASATSGENALPATTNRYYWYTYTMPSDGKLQISSEISHSVAVYSNSCENTYYLSGGDGKATITALSSGDKVFIRWYTENGGDFLWDLSVSPLEAGDNCALAATATSGDNTLPATANTHYWYTYTMPSDGKLQITSETAQYISVYSNTCGNLISEGGRSGSIDINSLSSGDKVFIQWNTYNEGNFDWNLSVVPLASGEGCTSAIEASAGTNELPTTSYGSYWYAYTMPSDGKLQITSATFAQIKFYDSCGAQYFQSEYQNATTDALRSGDEIIIRWNTNNGGNFDWDLSVLALEPGEDCISAVTATLGTNSTPATTNNYQWYQYTMPFGGEVEITAAAQSGSVFLGTCENLRYFTYISGNSTNFSAAEGEEVFIRWQTSGGGDFDWGLSVTPLAEGEDCVTAVAANTGTNSVPSVSESYYWYRYTMPSEGKLQITSETSRYVNVYSNTCENRNYEGYGYGNATITTLKSGDEVFIRWSTGSVGDFDWNLSFSPLEDGDNCGLSVTAIAGTNSVPEVSSPYHWYHYTMPSDGKLQVSATASSYVEVYSNSCENRSWVGSGYGNATVTTLNSGDEVLIRWSTDGGGDFDWNLSVTPLEAGDNCAIAATASLETNTTPSAPYWFEYSAPANGDYTISSLGTATSDTYLRIYSDCNGTSLGSSDDAEGTAQSTLTLSLAADQTIYILWDDTYSSAEFDWTISAETETMAEQEITFDPLSAKELDDEAFDLSATASSLLPVSYTSSDESVATVSGNTVSIAGVGTTTITASQAGNGVYDAAEPVARTLTVNRVSQAITMDPVADQLVDASPISVNATTTSGLPLTLSVAGPATISENEITLNGTEGTVRVTASQAGDDYYAAASSSISFAVTDPSLIDQTISFEVLPEKVVGDPAFDVTATTSSNLTITFTSSDETVATVSEQTVTIVGAGTTMITARQAGNETYRAASVSQLLTVSEQPGQTGTKDCTGLTATLTETVNVACSGAANGSLTVSATGGSAPYTYSIDGTTFQEAATFATLDSGSYVLTVKDANACTTTVEAKITTPEVLVVSGEASPSTRSAESGRITLSVSGGTAPYQYAWSNEATTATITDLVLGEYHVTVTDAGGCSATATFTVEGVTALADAPRQQQVVVYPNPADHTLYIEVAAGSHTKSATLYTVLGRKIAELNLSVGRYRLDTQSLKPGSYLLKFDDGSNRRVEIK